MVYILSQMQKKITIRYKLEWVSLFCLTMLRIIFPMHTLLIDTPTTRWKTLNLSCRQDILIPQPSPVRQPETVLSAFRILGMHPLLGVIHVPDPCGAPDPGRPRDPQTATPRAPLPPRLVHLAVLTRPVRRARFPSSVVAVVTVARAAVVGKVGGGVRVEGSVCAPAPPRGAEDFLGVALRPGHFHRSEGEWGEKKCHQKMSLRSCSCTWHDSRCCCYSCSPLYISK